MPEVRYDSADAEAAVRAFVRRAAAATEVPAPFELAGALRAGRRRVARRRVSAVAGAAALAAAVGAIAVLPTLEEPSGAPIPGESRTPAPSDEPREGLSTHASIEELVSRPYTAIGDTQFAGLAVSATMIRGCDKDLACDSVVLLTSDGWRSNVAHVVPGAGYVRTQLLPDGSVAFVPDQRVDTDAEPGVLHPDGRVSPLHVSTEPGFPTAGSVLTVEPLLDEPSFVPWVVDPDRATLRPLRTRPKGDRTGPPVVAADGTVFVTSFDVGGTPARVAIARSRDGGRTWDYSQVTARTPAATLAGYQAIRPDGRMSVVFSSDGATLSPLVELWSTTDAGRTWTEVRPEHRPRTISGMAYAPDGTLLLADDQQATLWRTTPDGSDLEPAPELPRVASIGSSGGVLFGQVATEGHELAVSVDGRDWQTVSLPADIRE